MNTFTKLVSHEEALSQYVIIFYFCYDCFFRNLAKCLSKDIVDRKTIQLIIWVNVYIKWEDVMEANFKYLTHNPEDEKWGFYLMVAGSAKIEPDTEYPPKGHPTGYNFHWNNGRVLWEYQVNYITEGEGIMETRDSRYHIRPGSIILLHPQVWHRYRPIKEIGWFEHYIGFRGEAADKFIKSSDILDDLNVFQIGFHESILSDLHDVFNEARLERPGYHQVCSGLVMHILGQIISFKKNENFSQTQIENTIQKACFIIRDNLKQNIIVEDIARNLNVDYSLFRKAFKKYTGLSPMQYHTSLRMKHATELLTSTDLTIKEIASRLGFCSLFYFSKLFKEKARVSPHEFRKGYNGRLELLRELKDTE
jgi:AraC-like DNA-binding protein